MRSCSTEDGSSFKQSSACSMEADSSPANDLDSDMDAYLSSTASDRAPMSSDTSAPGSDSDRGSDCYTPACYRLMCTDEDAPSKHEGAAPRGQGWSDSNTHKSLSMYLVCVIIGERHGRSSGMRHGWRSSSSGVRTPVRLSVQGPPGEVPATAPFSSPLHHRYRRWMGCVSRPHIFLVNPCPLALHKNEVPRTAHL